MDPIPPIRHTNTFLFHLAWVPENLDLCRGLKGIVTLGLNLYSHWFREEDEMFVQHVAQ